MILDNPAVTYFILPVCVGVVVWFVQSYFTRRSRVKATLTYSHLCLPDAIQEELCRLADRIGAIDQQRTESLRERLQKLADTAPNPPGKPGGARAPQPVSDAGSMWKSLFALTESLSPSQHTDLLEELTAEEYPWLASFFYGVHSGRWPGVSWEGEVTNVGHKSASGVRFEVPDAEWSLVTRPGGEPEFAAVRGLITIGELQPKETVSVVAWGGLGANLWQADSIVVRHDDGVGSVCVKIPARKSLVEFANVVSRLGWVALVTGAVLALCVAIALTSARRAPGTTQSPATATQPMSGPATSQYNP